MSSPRRVVITGIGALSPNGLGREAFFSNTLAGKSGVKRITRFAPEPFLVQVAGEIQDFDDSAWVTQKDRPHVARVVTLGAAAVAEALQDADIRPETMSRDELREIGIIVGTGGSTQEWTEEQYRLYYSGQFKQCSVYVIPVSTPGTMASEIAMRFGLRGMSHVVTTGCTSSTDAIGYGMRHIKSGAIDRMVVGGVDAPLAPLIMRGFQLMRIMASSFNAEPTRASRPFSKDREGFVIAEGAWFFVMEELESAKARGAQIYGEICGYGSTCEAFHRVRLEECGEEPARAMQLAMREAAVAPEQIDYVSYHGTSTELNDRIETRAIKLAFGDKAQRLPGSAIKSIIGHPQGACGAAGVAATLLSMRDGKVHPTINLETADPECDLDYVPHQARQLPMQYALANCIAFGSKNSALVLKNLR
jgi:3-oxoacyl-[acyl-carrier-protein] synthase II